MTAATAAPRTVLNPDGGTRSRPNRWVDRAAYGADQQRRFFFLDDMDRDLIALRRTKAHQLGFAVQMRTVRFRASTPAGGDIAVRGASPLGEEVARP